MTNINGYVVYTTLNTLNEPTTMTKIVALMAEIADLPVGEIKPLVLDILDNGVNYGFIQRTRGRYYVKELDPVIAEALDESCSTHLKGLNREPSYIRFNSHGKGKRYND